MSVKRTLNVVLYWHMHQPEYRDVRNGEYHLPWTYLHTIKDYVDMVAHLEACPEAKAVVNFAPILLEQIDDYAQQLSAFLKQGKALRDPLLSLLADPVIPEGKQHRLLIIKNCLRANEARLIDRFEAFSQLAAMSKAAIKEEYMLDYFDEQFFTDLVVWYHLAWMAETVRREDTRIEQLMNKARFFNMHDRRVLTEIIADLIQGVLGRYRKLAESGQVELSMTPYAHPIMPLLFDIESASEAMPNVKLPKVEKYPGGADRNRWHMQHGLAVFENIFGFKPVGCWPSEGSLSEPTVELLSEMGFKWTASGETVLRNSLKHSPPSDDACIHRNYQLNKNSVRCFFRDDGLSDLIGFNYSEWHADDAVANMIHHLENIAKACEYDDDAIVSIILDGENAWEYYPENGYYFLSALYKQLSSHEWINLTTYSDYLAKQAAPRKLTKLVAGSWVYGTFSTWIGDEDKNRGWEMLVDAKRTFDRVVASGRLDDEVVKQLEYQLAICEGSDWFWWFGDYNPSDSVVAFDTQYRLHLSNLYQLMGEEPPDYLSHSFSRGSGAPAMGGVMRPGKEMA